MTQGSRFKLTENSINVHYIRKALSLINRHFVHDITYALFQVKKISINSELLHWFFFRTCILAFNCHSCNVFVVVPHHHPSLRCQSYLINWAQNVGPVEISQVLKPKINPLFQSPVLLIISYLFQYSLSIQ